MLKNKGNNLLSNNIDDSLNYKFSIKSYCNKSSDSDNNYITLFSNLSVK